MKSVSLVDKTDREALEAHFADRAHFNEPLAPYTWWKIGGPADALIDATTTDELAFVLRRVFKRRLPLFVLGSGSNLLVGDGGIRGIVLRLEGDFTHPRAVVTRRRCDGFVRAARRRGLVPMVWPCTGRCSGRRLRGTDRWWPGVAGRAG